MSVVSAPGKALLIGEYAVLEGATALVTAVDVRAIARAPKGPRREPTPVVQASFAAAVEFVRARGLSAPEAAPLVDTGRFSRGARKLGLGSSAAVAATVVGHVLTEAGLDLMDPEVRQAAYELARAAHREAQGGGSGADVAASVLGGALRFCDGEARPVALPPWLRIAFVDAGAPATTASFVRQVKAAAVADPDAYDAAMKRLRGASNGFFAALERAEAGDDDAARESFAGLKDAVSAHNAGLRALQELSGAPILTATIDAIIDLAGELGLAAKPSGAGGGDLVVVFARSQAALAHLADRLFRERGIQLLTGLKAGAAGLRRDAFVPRCSRLAGFFRLHIDQRRAALAEACAIDPEDFEVLDPGALALDQAEHMIENVVGVLELPIAVATNFRVNGVDYLVPMCVEESSVVAAASNAAKMIRAGGGFVAYSDPPWMIAQIQLTRAPATDDAAATAAKIAGERDALLARATTIHPRLVARGGGPRALEVRILDPEMLAVHVVVDCRDAMGANLLNTIAEDLAPRLGDLTGWTPGLRILSNLADRRRAHVSARIPPRALASKGWDGAAVVDGIVSASRFAELDPYRAATHNKGIMNGIDAVVLATGNDWRAMESGAHAYAAETGQYRPIAVWSKGADGWLEGQLTVPMAIGTVGGATHVHPVARLALDILGTRNSAELGQVIAAVGMASNLAALRALATEGIQRGHMSLHARTLAVGAGATGAEIEALSARLVECGEIKHERAVAILRELRQTGRGA